MIRPDGSGRRSLTGGCGVGPGTPPTWLCVVNGRFAIPLADAAMPAFAINPTSFPRAVKFSVFVTDRERYVYGAPVSARQVAGPRVHVTTATRKLPVSVSDTGGRATFRFLKPRTHGKVVIRVSVSGRSRLLVLRV